FAQGSGVEIYSVGPRNVLGYYSGFNNTLFALIVEVDAATSFTTALIDVYNQAPVAVLVMLSVAGVLATSTSILIVTPLRSLQADIRAVGNGDFQRDIETLHRHDEIGELARAFANAREQLYVLISDLQARINERVRDIQATQEVSRFAVTQLD